MSGVNSSTSIAAPKSLKKLATPSVPRRDPYQGAASDAVSELQSTSSETAAMQLHHWFHFRDGKIDYYRGTEDTAITAATLGAS